MLLGWAASPDFLLLSETTGQPHAACSNRFFGEPVPIITCSDGSGGDQFRKNTDTLRFTHYRAGAFIHDSDEQQTEILQMGSCEVTAAAMDVRFRP